MILNERVLIILSIILFCFPLICSPQLVQLKPFSQIRRRAISSYLGTGSDILSS